MLKKIAYANWPNCLQLSDGKVEAVITTDVGPRVIRLGFPGQPNLFKEYTEQLGQTGGDTWRIFGGHRLWHAPEVNPRTYAPDNSPVQWEQIGENSVKLTNPAEPLSGISKEIVISLNPKGNGFIVKHSLINHNAWEIELAPWCLSVMAAGGRAVIPQEPFRPHPEYLLPARPLVLWHYSDMSDPRWTWGKKFIQLRQDPAATTKQKVGLYNHQGWAAYLLGDQVFIKRYATPADAKYCDYGCNSEYYTDKDMLEVESLGPLARLAPEARVEHEERWYLFPARIAADEAALERDLLPLVQQTT